MIFANCVIKVPSISGSASIDWNAQFLPINMCFWPKSYWNWVYWIHLTLLIAVRVLWIPCSYICSLNFEEVPRGTMNQNVSLECCFLLFFFKNKSQIDDTIDICFLYRSNQKPAIILLSWPLNTRDRVVWWRFTVWKLGFISWFCHFPSLSQFPPLWRENNNTCFLHNFCEGAMSNKIVNMNPIYTLWGMKCLLAIIVGIPLESEYILHISITVLMITSLHPVCVTSQNHFQSVILLNSRLAIINNYYFPVIFYWWSSENKNAHSGCLGGSVS